MGYREIWQPRYDEVRERYPLVMERIGQIGDEETTPQPYRGFFRHAAAFLSHLGRLEEEVASGRWEMRGLREMQQENRSLYEEILPGNYGKGYASPKFAAEALGEPFGKLFSALYADFRSLIPCAFEGRIYEITIFGELFVEIYNCFEADELPAFQEIEAIVYWFYHDYEEIFTENAVLSQTCPELDFHVRVIMDSDLSDPRYLYRYGAYVTENELRTAQFLGRMPEEEIRRMADAYTEGYRIGFEVTGKDLSKKKFVELRYPIGFERMMRAAVLNFERMGLSPVVSLGRGFSADGRGLPGQPVTSVPANRQYEYDHREDKAAYLDKSLEERRLACLRSAYAKRAAQAALYGGPAVVETFGEAGFVPEKDPCAYHYDEEQRKINVYGANMAAQAMNAYIKGEERSFTIIAFPIPEIGPEYERIFQKTVEVNTLDYRKYRAMQQRLIDVLDGGDYVRVTGRGKNMTDLTVALCPIGDPAKETIFENCVADVNIPAGEVFTSPVLKGTNGRLHVTEAYLEGLRYQDLEVDFKDGMVSGYSCGNFGDGEEGQAFLRENLLKHHDTLPMGEFAIGTNTTAYRMGMDFQIRDRLPVLIAEKAGPHFAVGDTCYSWAEDIPVFNPDGKEIISRDNEVSILRKEDAGKAYFNCHTDITLPYDEVGRITVHRPDGTEEDIIRDGRFVVPGTLELNIPLDAPRVDA